MCLVLKNLLLYNVFSPFYQINAFSYAAQKNDIMFFLCTEMKTKWCATQYTYHKYLGIFEASAVHFDTT